MSPLARSPLRALGLAVLLASTGCGILGPDPLEEGTVHFEAVEGGCWTIETTKETFFPLNLADQFRIESLPVRFAVESEDSGVRICPGTPVHLREIHAVAP